MLFSLQVGFLRTMWAQSDLLCSPFNFSYLRSQHPKLIYAKHSENVSNRISGKLHSLPDPVLCRCLMSDTARPYLHRLLYNRLSSTMQQDAAVDAIACPVNLSLGSTKTSIKKFPFFILASHIRTSAVCLTSTE